MLEKHLRQPGFTYSACDTFTNNKESIQKFKETGDWKYIYQNKLDKACFQHDIVHGNFKDLPRRAVSDKVLLDKALNITKKSEIWWISKIFSFIGLYIFW